MRHFALKRHERGTRLQATLILEEREKHNWKKEVEIRINNFQNIYKNKASKNILLKTNTINYKQFKPQTKLLLKGL